MRTIRTNYILIQSEEEDSDEQHFYPLTLRTRKTNDHPQSPLDSIAINGGQAPEGSPKQG